jgi:hypothetical protein
MVLVEGWVVLLWVVWVLGGVGVGGGVWLVGRCLLIHLGMGVWV